MVSAITAVKEQALINALGLRWVLNGWEVNGK